MSYKNEWEFYDYVYNVLAYSWWEQIISVTSKYVVKRANISKIFQLIAGNFVELDRRCWILYGMVLSVARHDKCGRLFKSLSKSLHKAMQIRRKWWTTRCTFRGFSTISKRKVKILNILNLFWHKFFYNAKELSVLFNSSARLAYRATSIAILKRWKQLLALNLNFYNHLVG